MFNALLVVLGTLALASSETSNAVSTQSADVPGDTLSSEMKLLLLSAELAQMARDEDDGVLMLAAARLEGLADATFSDLLPQRQIGNGESIDARQKWDLYGEARSIAERKGDKRLLEVIGVEAEEGATEEESVLTKRGGTKYLQVHETLIGPGETHQYFPWVGPGRAEVTILRAGSEGALRLMVPRAACTVDSWNAYVYAETHMQCYWTAAFREQVRVVVANTGPTVVLYRVAAQ